MKALLFGSINQSFFDSYWVAVHFASGLIVGIIILHYFRYKERKASALSYSRYGIIILLVWEYFEVFLRFTEKYELRIGDYLNSIIPRSLFEIESTTNILSDLILGSLGLFLVYQYWKRSYKTRESDQ